MNSDTRMMETAAAAAGLRGYLEERRWSQAALAGLGVTIVALLPLLINDRFYFNDDYQSYFMPMFREIARLLLAGEFPLSTPKIWFGGAIAGEYQYAVFHPFCLALYLVISGFDNLVAAATFYSLIHVFVLAAGLFALCRHLGCAPLPAFTGALIGCTSSWLLYWGASNWIPALVSEAWMVWTLLFLLLAYDSRKFVPAASVATALTLLAGWPFADLALALSVAALTVLAVGIRAGAGGVWRAGVALALGALLAMPALLTAASYLAESGRQPDVAYLWSLTLNGLLSAGVPSAAEVWNFQEEHWVPSTAVQMLYASWLIPLALAVGGWGRLWRERRQTLIAALALTALFALGAMMPGLWHFRWFFRLLPFYHAALAVLTALLFTFAAPAAGRWGARYPLALAAVFAPFVIPTAIESDTYVLSALFGVVILFALVSAFDLGRRNVRLFRGALIGGHVLVFVVMVAVWPRSLQVPVWDYPAAGPGAGYVARETSPRRLSLYNSSLRAEPGAAYWSMVSLGNTAAYLDAETVNGYSPPVQRGIARLFCFDFKGGVCAGDAVKRLFEPRWQGLSPLDLAGIDEVATDSAELRARFAALAGNDWKVAARNGPDTVFTRRSPLPDQPTAPPPDGLVVTETARSARQAAFDLHAGPGFAGGSLAIRRPWYPGVYASLNGRPLEVETIERAMPVVRLEAGAEGKLVVGYWPAGLTRGLVLAGLGVLLLAAVILWPGRLLAPPPVFSMIWRRLTALSARPSEGSCRG